VPRQAAAFLKLKGARELDRKLARLEKRTAKKVMRKALRAGGKVILAEAKRRAPKRTGALAASLKVRAAKRSRRRRGVAVIVATAEGWFKGDEFYGAFVELGTEDMEAQPYVRPAYDAKKGQAVQVIMTEAGRGIEAEAQKA